MDLNTTSQTTSTETIITPPADAADTTATPRKKSRRGFAAMSPEKQREIAQKGGRAAHIKGTAHEFNSETARAAGRKGGLANRRAPTTTQQ